MHVLKQELVHLGYDISKEDIKRGFLNTRWAGRFTILNESPYFVVDGAHNMAAAEKLLQSLKMYFHKQRFIFIMGMFKDKEYEEISKMMAPLADQIFTIEAPDNPRALRAIDLAKVVEKYNPCVTDCLSIESAVQQSFEKAKETDVIVAFGSLSFIGDITKCVVGGKDD